MRTRQLRWVAPVIVLGIAAALRFWALDRPGTLVFDELYYVRDAISQLSHGFPTIWPDSEPDMSGDRATAFTADPTNAVHPPLGKWLIGLGVLLFGPESGWGWRSASAFAGVATVGIVMRLGWLLSRSMLVACLAGLLLAIDGVNVVLSRVGLLDGFLAMFIALGALFVWQDQLALAQRFRDAAVDPKRPLPVVWARPWLVAAGLAFGAAAAVKWSGLYPLAAFLIFVTIRDLLLRLRSRTPRPWSRAVGQAGVAALLTLPLTALTYLASWIGWILAPGGWGRTPGEHWFPALVRYHRDMLEWHSTLSAPHPYQAHPLTWPLALRPTAMYEHRWADGCPWTECVSAVSPLPNPLVTWGGVFALGVLLWFAVRSVRVRRASAVLTTARHAVPPRLGPAPAPALAIPLGTVSGFVLIGYLSGWLPWVATVSRSAVFQFYAVVLTPFAALALALVLGVACRIGALSRAADELGFRAPAAAELQGRRIAAALFVACALALALFFFPAWSGQPIADWFWRAHLWLPGWA
ncbi:phospholipid carrier-dependent glycosyltransferase [Leucobacter chromiireducens]|uniref:phospholipid carrier-dependent glycosyltransferase n=1 Tax=Leucobacter chromiireducens TaxID=283877 RepID=UPI001F00933C|nr:phospholipid carrier-dependent glycosyltransferase [Leucobacter chromiireducens]